MPLRRLLIATLIPLALLALLTIHPQIAFATGTYTVHTCKTPSGRFTGSSGWTSATSVSLAGYDAGSTTPCDSPGSSAGLQFGGSGLLVKVGSWLSWDFQAPDDTSINSYELARAFNLGWPVISRMANRSYLLQIWHDDDPNAGLIDFKKPVQSGETLVQPVPVDDSTEGVRWGSLHVSLRCWELVGSLDCGPYPAQVTISRAAIGLADPFAPTAFQTGGELAGIGPVRGAARLLIHAEDSGGGIYRTMLAVDGDQVSNTVLDDNGGSCADVEPSNDDAYEFGTPQPCPLTVDGAVQLDTRALRDGQHTVHVSVEDAGGNRSVVYDGIVQTHNAPINAIAPTVVGQPSIGGQLNANPGQWDAAPNGYDYRWLRCEADGTDCAPVAGASSATYTPTETDAYRRMQAEVTAANGSGSSTARSAPSAPVADAAGHTAPPSGQSGGGGGGGASGAGGIQGIVNPLGQLPGHVGNGDNATVRAKLTAAFQRADGRSVRTISVRQGRRVAIVGRLTDASGAAIGNAHLGAAWRVTGRGWVARPGARTGADGRFVYLLPAGPSRDVRLTYFAYSDSGRVELSNVVHVDVLASLTIHADRTRVAGDHVVRLSGRVDGGAIPRGGLLVTLQGFQAGWGWRAFRTVRTDRHGIWSTRYRFRSSSGRFGFRALVPHQGRFPFATSRSAGVFVVLS
jgi:hypothetical protein